jgi:hypothetical protein
VRAAAIAGAASTLPGLKVLWKYSRLPTTRPRVAAAIALLATLPTSNAAATCALIGDSIAQDLREFFRECDAHVKLGIGTKAIAALMPAHVDVIIVSAGSNDYLTPGLLARLQAVRSRAGAVRVIWIRPAPKSAADAVDAVAHAHGDTVVPFAVSRRDREHLHPQSNETLAADISRHLRSSFPDGPQMRYDGPQTRSPSSSSHHVAMAHPRAGSRRHFRGLGLRRRAG